MMGKKSLRGRPLAPPPPAPDKGLAPFGPPVKTQATTVPAASDLPSVGLDNILLAL